MNYKLATLALLGLGCFTLALAATPTPNTREADSTALMAIRTASGNSVGNSPNPWVSGTPIDQWSGVGLQWHHQQRHQYGPRLAELE